LHFLAETRVKCIASRPFRVMTQSRMHRITCSLTHGTVTNDSCVTPLLTCGSQTHRSETAYERAERQRSRSGSRRILLGSFFLYLTCLPVSPRKPCSFAWLTSRPPSLGTGGCGFACYTALWWWWSFPSPPHSLLGEAAGVVDSRLISGVSTPARLFLCVCEYKFLFDSFHLHLHLFSAGWKN
jgi:hypothetical protein